MKLLHIDASILGQHSTSRQLTAEVVAEWQKNHPNTSVEYLDVVANPIPHFTADAIAIKGAPQEAVDLYRFMQGPQAKAILQKYGYTTP